MADAVTVADVVADLSKFKALVDARDADSSKRMDRFEVMIAALVKSVDSLVTHSAPSQVPISVSDSVAPVSMVVPAPIVPPMVQNPTVVPQRSVKIDFPKFDGTEPLQWLFRADQFFAYYHTPDDQRLTIAAVNMEGDAVAWYQLMLKHQLLPTWDTLAKAFAIEFGPSRFDSPRARLFKLVQMTTVASYYTDFRVLATRVEGVSDEGILECFISGLKPTLRRDVLAHSPPTLLRAA